MTDDTAGIVGVYVECSRDGAALNEVLALAFAVGKAHEARHVALVGGDGARHGEVLDGGVLDVAEGGCAAVDVVGNRSGDGVAAAEEGSLERVGLARACHGRDADVCHQLHRLAAISHARLHICAESIPFILVADEVVTTAVGRDGPSRPDGHVAGRHGEGGAGRVLCAERTSATGNVLDEVAVAIGVVAQREAYHVVAGSIEHFAVFESPIVEGQPAYVVRDTDLSAIGHSNTRATGDGVSLLGATDGARVGGRANLRFHVVAVGDGAAAAL